MLQFTSQQLLASRLAGLEIGAVGDGDASSGEKRRASDQPGSSTPRMRTAEEEGADSSGGETDVQPTPDERGQSLVSRARALLLDNSELEDGDAVEARVADLRSLLREIVDLLARRERELSVVLTEQLRRFVRRLANAETSLDPSATQPPDSQFPLADEESQRSQSQSRDDLSAGDAAGFDDDAPPSGGSSQLASQLADDLEELEELDDASAAAGPGDATQLEGMDLEGDDRRTVRLRALRDDVVSVLRDMPADGNATPELRSRARALRLRVQPFQTVSEAARRMLAALAEVLASAAPQVAGDGGAGSPERPSEPSIVGRATDVIPVGTRRQSFLLFQPPNRYQWLTEAGMLADAVLREILNAYAGNKGDDPSGNGWVTAVLAARGPTGRRQYKVLWTVEPQVPVKHAEEWMPRGALVPGAQALADAFERRDDDDEESEDDDDAVSAGPESEPSQLEPNGVARKSALQWDPGAGRPKLSLRRAIAAYSSGQPWTVRALIEYTLTRIWALRSRTPPAPGQPGAPSQSELDQLGRDLFTIDEKALVAAFKRERVQAQRDARLEAEAEEDEEQEEDDEDALLATWRAERETELRDEAQARWAQTRLDDAADLATLRDQLSALKAVEAAGGDPSEVDAEELDDESASVLLNAWSAAGDAWPSQLTRPRLKLPRIRDFLNPNRSAKARGWLKLQRDVHSAASAQDRQVSVYGSAYGPSWPTRPSATSCPADHVSPTRWFEGGTKLIIECSDPAQTPAVVISKLEENSAKSDDALALFSTAGEAARAGQGVYAPRNVSTPKKAMLAKTVAWVWLLYPLVSDKKRSVGIGAYARSTGSAWYARAFESGPFQALVQSVGTPFERRIQLLALGMPRWQVGNPLVFDASSVDDDVRRLLLDRFKGEDALPRLVDAVLQAGVVSAPR